MSTATPRPRITLEGFLERGADAVGMSLVDRRSRKRDSSIVRARESSAWIGVELYDFTVKEMAAGLGK